MKKLKFLLIPLFSLLFIINVKADTTYTIEYSNDTISFVQNNNEMLEAFDTWLNNEGKIRLYNNLGNYTDYSLTQYYFYYLDVSKYNNNHHFKVIGFPIVNQNLSSTISLNITSNSYMFIYGNSVSSEVLYNENNNSFSWVSTNKEYSSSVNMNYYSDSVLVDSVIKIKYIYNNSHGIQEQNYSNLTLTTNNNNDVLQIGSENYVTGDRIDIYNFIESLNSVFAPPEPTYTYTTEVLENGNVRVNFSFNNYNEGNYAFEIENAVSNEEYGITNPFLNIFPKIIPYGNSYSIEIYFDTLLYVTLSKYEQIEQSSLYYKNELYTDVIDINNVVFENELDPYFMIQTRTKNNITGRFYNTTNDMTCWSRYSDSQTEQYVDCNDGLGFSFQDNGYVEVIIKKGNNVIYSRKINYIANDTNAPYIVYEINKQDFYSVINWYIENEESNSTYRYSIDNGQNFTAWINYNSNNNKINVFDNNTIIIEIANNNQSTIYDSKSIVVVNDISEIKNINNTTINFLDKFRNIFNVNTNILSNINNFYDNIKVSKIYLLIFIPFLASLIGAIIYLIRRK